MAKILLIDSNETWLQTLKSLLSKEGYAVFTSTNSSNGLKIAWREMPDLVILNLFLPTTDGFETCRRLREIGVGFILVTSQQRDDRSIVRALEMGADDFLDFPPEQPILLAKIKTMLRRSQRDTASRHSVFDDGHLQVDLSTRTIQVDKKPVKLTPTEFRLLSILLKRAGRVVTHEELIKEIWGTEKDTSLGSLKLYIHYLRQKIEDKPKKPQYLLAEWGVGYRFQEPQTTPAG